jgi:hypothetical protein
MALTSVFGFDRWRITERHDGRARRRVSIAAEKSLLLLKVSGGQPHGGGVRILPDRPEYETLRRWIAAGLPVGSASDPKTVKIELMPHEETIDEGESRQLVVTATLTNGKKLDVTRLAKFQSNNDGLASVSEEGLVTAGQTPGVVAVMASYANEVDVFHVLIPRNQETAPYPEVVGNNFIDQHVYRRLKQLNIVPAKVCSDAEFLRRVYLDLIGTLPTAEEARRFLADTKSDKRKLLVDELLMRPEFADYWALKWADLLRVDRQVLGHKAAYDEYRWIKDSLAKNKPLDQFAREVITASGPLAESPQGYIYKTARSRGGRRARFRRSSSACGLNAPLPPPSVRSLEPDGLLRRGCFPGWRSHAAGDVLLAVGDPATTIPPAPARHRHPLGRPMPGRPATAAWLAPGSPRQTIPRSPAA